MRALLIIGALLTLCGCQTAPLQSYSMQADGKVYPQLQKHTFLKHKLTVGDITYSGSDKHLGRTFLQAKTALSDSLAISGYLADSGEASYIIAGVIKDVKYPRCFLGTCESGSSIEYTITDINMQKAVYNELLVVPYTKYYVIFSSGSDLLHREALGEAIGENFAHLLHVLELKTKADLSRSIE